MKLYITLHFERINNFLLLCCEKYNGRVTLVYRVMVLEAIIITFDKNSCVYHVKFYTAMYIFEEAEVSVFSWNTDNSHWI